MPRKGYIEGVTEGLIALQKDDTFSQTCLEENRYEKMIGHKIVYWTN